MPVTYQIEPVVDAIRSYLDQEIPMTAGAEQPIPLLSAISQYSFDPSICPILVVDPVDTTADWSRYASGDVQLTLDLRLHEIRVRSGNPKGEEAAAIEFLSGLAASFSNNYRLNGNVQNIVVESITVAEPDVLHRLGIPEDEHQTFAIATMALKVIWIESCFAAA